MHLPVGAGNEQPHPIVYRESLSQTGRIMQQQNRAKRHIYIAPGVRSALVVYQKSPENGRKSAA